MVDESKRRTSFPDYVPMFTFPNDVSVVSSDERPRSTWHGFAMTNQDNSKLYGVVVTLWVPLNSIASDALERQCEEWRKANGREVVKPPRWKLEDVIACGARDTQLPLR